MNYPLLIRHYRENGKKYADAERKWFAGQPSLDDAIEVAASATDGRGKRYSHQRRIPRAAITKAKPALLKERQKIQDSKTFEHLLDTVSFTLKNVDGLGELYYYDTALRLAFYLHIEPTRVHLHAGARDGARALGLDYQAPCLSINSVPRILRQLPPHEIEDFFCIYKDKMIRSLCGK